MARTLPKSVIESKPLHAVAGAGDLAVEKIRVLSKLAAERVSAVESDPVAVSNRIQEGIEQRAETLGATLRDVSADVRVQLQDLSVKAQQMLQTALLQANQTYDALAERGRDVVVRLGGLDGHELESTPAPVTEAPVRAASASEATADGSASKPASKAASRTTSRKKTSASQTATPAASRTASRTRTEARKTSRTTKKS